MQGVELIGAGGEHGTIERLGLAQLPALMQRGGTAQRIGEIGLRGLRFGLRMGHGESLREYSLNRRASKPSGA